MIKALLAGTAGLALAMPLATPVLASDHGGDEVKVQGRCSGTSKWELKVESEDSGVKVEFQVDSHVPGQAWDYTISGPAGQIASGSATTDEEGEFEVKVLTAGSVTDAFSAVATNAGETCDSAVGVVADDDSEDVDEGMCTDDSSIVLTVKKTGQKRIATLSVDARAKGEKWRYSIKRGAKVVQKGSARTRGKHARFSVKAKTRAKGVLTADATRSDGSEECTTDDSYDD